jgi:hypothetical protein
MAISFDMRVTVSADVVTRHLDEELIMLDLDTENYFGLDEVGTRMWEVLSSTPSVQAAFDQLLSEYDVDAERLHVDLEKLVTQLLEHGLVRVQAD